MDLPDRWLALAKIHAGAGRQAEALAALDEFTRIAGQTRAANRIARMRIAQAEVHAALVQVDEAVAALRSVYESGWALGYTLRHLAWEPLRGDAKFQQLMKDAEARANAQPQPKY